MKGILRMQQLVTNDIINEDKLVDDTKVVEERKNQIRLYKLLLSSPLPNSLRSTPAEAESKRQNTEDGQEYAQVLRMLGNGRCEAMCIDGTKRLCHIRGKMHKKVWIAAGDIILVGLRDYQDDKADVILKYMPDEARLLKAYGELPENTRLNEGIVDEEDDGGADDYVEFEDEDIDKI
ncbi:hypothetical protein V6N12_007522 [Hibiscus sabdariffa]|uniref:Eukaryotic translation initiation factor 4C n=1 Tax=Hibiscus sabdariffa TaxID=183260 RepID=A0ABR2F219_9ROSI